MPSQEFRFRRLLFLLLLIGLFNCADFFATQALVVYGEHGEWNPFMRELVGTPYFALYKLVFIPLGLLFLWIARKRVVPKYLVLVKFSAGVYTALMIYTWLMFYS